MLSRFASLTRAPTPSSWPEVAAEVPAPSPRPKVKARRTARIFRLYPEPLRPAQVQARALLTALIERAPVGGLVLKIDLERLYAAIAVQKGWSRLHWNLIGTELAKLTKRRTVKRQGKKCVAYLVPRGVG